MKDYDGNEYNTVKIGDQCWMKENMRTTRDRNGKTIAAGNNYTYSKSTPYRYAPDNNPSIVRQYGFLYNYPAAMLVCPKGWHLPTKGEFDALETYCGEHYAVGGNKGYIAKGLASKTGWKLYNYKDPYAVGYNQSANNASGFSAVPAGRFIPGTYDGIAYEQIDYGAYLWSATSYGSDYA
ncbi:MAG: fibrobacter succinogenes major paralogous domain-containing protein, partial [Bacteroidales bacterium]|nr:fibrobacter succinogenes major paralogous domain-containing protein [Bacteroidales bacterium]